MTEFDAKLYKIRAKNLSIETGRKFHVIEIPDTGFVGVMSEDTLRRNFHCGFKILFTFENGEEK